MTDADTQALEDFGFATSNADHGDKVVAALVILDWGAQLIEDDGFVAGFLGLQEGRKPSDSLCCCGGCQ